MSRGVSRQMGFALLPCALLLVVVLLALGASLRSARQQLAGTWTYADQQTARLLAEASLSEGEQHLRSAFLWPTNHEGSQMAAYPFALLCNPASGAHQGYRLVLLRADDRSGLCQITATGTGLIAETRVSLQAEFELHACPLGQATSQPLPMTTRVEAIEQAPVMCKGDIHLISWRALNEV